MLRKICILAISLLTLLIPLISCKTLPTVADSLEWASVPDPKDALITYDAETDSVTIQPYSYYIQIIEYIVDTETNKKTLYGDELKKH